MELYIDIADIDEVKRVAEYYPIDGFTTNPKILTKAERPIEEMMSEYKAFVEENNVRIFFQVMSETAEEMLEEAKAMKAYFGEHLVIKIPAMKEGYKAVSMVKKEGIPVCVTVVHSMTQALMAAKAGADYVAPYVTHIDNIGADGIQSVSDMVIAFKNGGYGCRVLGASFRTADQIKCLALVGCQAVTITPQMFDELIKHPSTNESMAGFKKAWKKKFGDKKVSDFLL